MGFPPRRASESTLAEAGSGRRGCWGLPLELAPPSRVYALGWFCATGRD